MHRISLAAGDVVYAEGQMSADAYLVLSGEVMMDRQGVALTAAAGSVIGLSALANRPYGTTATARQKSDLLVFTRRELRGMIRSDPDRAMMIIDGIIDLLARLNTAMDETTSGNP
jgi:CRP-like cAMP-binding protein